MVTLKAPPFSYHNILNFCYEKNSIIVFIILLLLKFFSNVINVSHLC